MPLGLIQPMQRDLDDFANAGGSQELTSRIEQVLTTRATSPGEVGELPWRPEFGSAIHRLKHRNMEPAILGLAREYVGEALRRWVPELSSMEIDVYEDRRNNALTIRVRARRKRAKDIEVDVEVAVELGEA